MLEPALSACYGAMVLWLVGVIVRWWKDFDLVWKDIAFGENLMSRHSQPNRNLLPINDLHKTVEI